MGIRGKLLVLVVVIAVPLLLVEALELRNMWRLSRAQLDDSVKQQVELAAVALERWLDDQKKALDAIAALSVDKDTRSPAINENLENVLRTRPFWIDLRITNEAGITIMSQPARKEFFPSALADHLFSEMRERNSWTVITDRTQDETNPIVIIGVPIEKGGAVIARIDGGAINRLFDSILLSRQVVISVLDSDGRALYRRRGSDEPMGADVSWAPLSSVLGASQTNVVELTSPVDGIKRVYGIAHIRETGLVAMIGIPSSTLYEPAQRRLNRYAMVGLIALIFAISAALVIERRIVKPVRRLRATAQRLGAGDLAARAPVQEAGEIGDLAKAFNTMAVQIQEREARLTELDRLKSDFVSSVSHELKTPLTTIKVLAHLLQREGLGDEERLDYLKTIVTECDRQIDFVVNLLDLSRIESGGYKLTKSRVDVNKLIDSCVEVERHRAKSRGLTLTTDVAPELPPVQADFEALRRVLHELIDNAIKYTPEGGQVLISAQNSEKTVRIAVADDGQGITPADLPHVFDKFYRGNSASDAAETDQTSSGTAVPGVGLGLYLARHIIEQFSGTITVESKSSGGTIFTVLLPESTNGAHRADLESTTKDD